MKSKLSFLLALLTLTAVFASPALAVTTDFVSPAGGSTISTPTNIVVQTAAPALSVELLDGTMTSLGFATPNGAQTTWTFLLDPALHANGTLFLNARSHDGVTQELASPALLLTIANRPAVTWVTPANPNVRTPDSLQITTDGTETNVQFFFRGSALIGTIMESPADTYTMAFDPDDYANGVGDLRADVTNPNGTTQKIYGINIDNLSAAPGLNAPTEGTTIPGSAGALLQAGTSIEYDGVEFFFDGVSIGQAVEEGAPDSNDWRLQFNTSTYSLGAHTVSARSTNGTLVSAPTTVNVTLVDDIDPTVDSYTPLDGSAVAGSFSFTISTSDNVGATAATYSLDGSNFSPMTSQGGGVFNASVDVSALPNGITFVYVEVTDARSNSVGGNTSVTVANPQAPALNTGELEYFGSTQVGSEGMNASGATATGTPTPTVGYSWRVCDPGVTCNSYAGQSYSPIASDVGRTVELVVRASNGVDPQDTQIIAVGTVTAADPQPIQEPTPTPASTPTPAPEPTPVAPPVVVTPPVVPPAAAPIVTTIVNTSSAPQKVLGTAGPDRIVTGSGYDVIRAGAGGDVISPGKGGGLVYAGAGNDVIRALSSKDLVVNCGTGKDTLFANQTTRSVGCEKIVVASNNKMVTVKAGADKLPVMPANFISPFSPTAKAPTVVVAEKKAAVVAAAVAEAKEQEVAAAQRAAAAAKALADAKAALLATAKADAAAAAAVETAIAAVAAKRAAVIGAKKQEAIDAAKLKLAIAETALTASRAAKEAAAAKRAEAELTALKRVRQSLASAAQVHTAAATQVVAATAQVQTTQDVVVAQDRVVVAFATAVGAQKDTVAAIDENLQQVKKDLAAAESAKAEAALKLALEAMLAKKKAEALELLDKEKKRAIQQKLLDEAKLKQIEADKLAKLAKAKEALAAQRALVVEQSAGSATRLLGARRTP